MTDKLLTQQQLADELGGSCAPWTAGANKAPAGVSVWYEQLRDHYRPARLEVGLIGEFPPDPAAGERRHFYAPTVTRLYRNVSTS